MGLKPDQIKIIKELGDKLDGWAKQREPKLPEHVRQGNRVRERIGHLNFSGSLKNAINNLPDFVLTWLRSNMPEQLESIQKDLDHLYEKARFVDHERSETGGEANIAKCQAQAAAKKLAEKLRFLADLHRKQIETKGQPAESEQKPAINVNISGDFQARNLQIGQGGSIHDQPIADNKSKGHYGTILEIIGVIINFLKSVFWPK
jgi:hypothetical protein